MERFTSQKKKPQIALNGYFYRLESVLKSGKQSWRCVGGKCKGRIHVSGNEADHVADHNHTPDPALQEGRICVSKLREKAAASHDLSRQIIQETQSNLSQEAVAKLPKYRSLQKIVQRKRRFTGEHQPSPRGVRA